MLIVYLKTSVDSSMPRYLFDWRVYIYYVKSAFVVSCSILLTGVTNLGASEKGDAGKGQTCGRTGKATWRNADIASTNKKSFQQRVKQK